MSNAEIHRLIELLGQEAQDNPKVKALVAAAELSPKMAGPVEKLLRNMLQKFGIDPDDPRSLPLVTRLPEEGARVGTVINGRLAGPVFRIPEGTPSDIENVGLFGLPRWGKTRIMMALAKQTMLSGNAAWMLDVEDQFSPLVDEVPEPHKPIPIVPEEHLMLSFFEPPGPWVTVKSWLQIMSSLLRAEVFIRDGAQNLFEASLLRVLRNKGVFAGSDHFPSMAETLCFLQGLKLDGSQTRGKTWLESLLNRVGMLVNVYERTAHVTSSNMLRSLANRSVIFRLPNTRGIPLRFLSAFLLTWLSRYMQNPDAGQKVLTLFLDEQHLTRVDKGRNDIGCDALASLVAEGPKRGIRTVLSNQLISTLDEEIFGNLASRIITRMANPKCMWLIQQSMGMSPAQGTGITRLKKKEIIVSYGGCDTPFKAKVDDLAFPPKPEGLALEKHTQDFMATETWKEGGNLAGEPIESEVISGDVLKVFIRIADAPETIEDRCLALNIERAVELRARKILEAKGYVVLEETTVGNRLRIHKVSAKGIRWAEQQKSKGIHLKIRRYSGGPVHEYLVDRMEKTTGSLNSKYKLQRHSVIAREHDIRPDLVLFEPDGIRTIIEICCSNLEYEAKTLIKERRIAGVDRVLAIAPNSKVKDALELELNGCQPEENDSDELARLVVLHAGECLSEKFDWTTIFENL